LDARQKFLAALKGKTDPEIKRQAITDTFYADVFSQYSRTKDQVPAARHDPDRHRRNGGRHQRHHNVLAQLGIDPEKEYGYR
jgi:GMP synthase (glutamine-hydrolysing)